METNLEKAKKQLQTKLNQVGITLSPDSIIVNALTLAATPDKVAGKAKSIHLKNGVYVYHEGVCYTLDEWKSQQPDITIAEKVVLATDYFDLILDKHIIGQMTYDKAMQYPLPDSTQGHQIGINRDILKPVIEAISGEWSDSWFWTRSECNSNSSWFYYGSYGFLDFSGKGSSISVRPVTAFQLSSLNFKTPKEAKSLRKK